MPKPRTPTEVLEAKGAYKHDPGRRRPPSPVSNEPIGDPPDWLSDAEADAWVDIVRTLPEGVARRPDKYALAVFCQLQVKVQTGDATANDRTQLLKILSLFGLTPSDRSRVAVPSEQKENAFSRFRGMK